MQNTILKYIACTLIVCGFLCATRGASAQFSGTVSGVVLDPTGAIVPNVSLSLRNKSTNEQRTTTSTAAGVYQFISLPFNFDSNSSTSSIIPI